MSYFWNSYDYSNILGYKIQNKFDYNYSPLYVEFLVMVQILGSLNFCVEHIRFWSTKMLLSRYGQLSVLHSESADEFVYPLIFILQISISISQNISVASLDGFKVYTVKNGQ